jgi:prepilin-type N-terminal cleavage/methylation domain-containing protein
MDAPLRRIRTRARSQAGFGMVELICAMVVLSVGILAVFAMYHSSFVQVTRAAKITTAAALADTEMERFRAITYVSIGLDSSAVAAADSTYTGSSGGAYKAISSPVNQVNSTAVVAACPGTPCTNAVPTKTVTGADHRSYRVDTYVTWEAISNSSGIAGRNVKLITVIVRDTLTSRIYARVASSFDESTGL